MPAPPANNRAPTRAPEEAALAPGAADGIQEQIASLVASLLGQPSVSADANFFLLGGHSMLAVLLLARIRDQFGVKMKVRQLFSGPTIRALSAEVARLRALRARG